MKAKFRKFLKFSPAEAAILILALCFCFFLGGYVFGSSRSGGSVEVELSNRSSGNVALADQLDDEGASGERVSDNGDGKVNINTASAEELAGLSGIGEVLAERIISYRDEHGDFSTVYDLTDVYGIGENKLEAILDYITVG